MTERRHLHPLPLGGEDGLPFSKGLMARALIATGVPATRAYELALRIEADLTARGRDSVELERLYQLATETNESNVGDTRNFAHGAIRRVRAESLLDCLMEVTEAKEKFPGLPLGARAVEIDPRIVAVEHNIVVVKRQQYDSTMVGQGDEIEIVRFVGGG